MKEAARFLGLAVLGAVFAQAQPPDPLDTLYDTNQWFRLREAVGHDPEAPLFFRGAVELAFHQWDQAERDLGAAARAVPAAVTVDTMDQASQAALAMKSLADLYSLAGRYRDAAEQYERFQRYVESFGANALVAKMGAREKRSYRALFSGMARFSDQSIEKGEYSQTTYSATRGRPAIRVAFGGKASSLLIDTGSSVNFINPSEARRMGLVLHAAESPIAEYDGDSGKVKGFAIADELTIGNFRLRNVAFYVNSEDDPEAPGILGLPGLFALGTVRWGSDGTIEFGFPSAGGERPNLATNGSQLITEGVIAGEHLMLNLDTGADETLVYPSFARVLGMEPETSGHGLDRDRLSARAPRLTVAGFEVWPASGNLTFTRQTAGFDGFDGNLGLDLLEQGSGITLDLMAMRLTVSGALARGGFLEANPARCVLPPGFVCQQGFTCTVWLQDEDPCTIDRVTPGVAGGEIGKAPDGCVVPENLTCGRMEECVVSAGANGMCEVRKSAASAAPVASDATESRPADGGPVAVPPKANLTDGEVRELLRSVSDDDLNFEPSRNYVYLDDEETRFLDAKGNVTNTTRATHESIVLYGERYEKLVARDGKPLSAKEARSEQQKLDKESERRKKETPEVRAKRLAEDRACTNDFLAAFRFHSDGVEAVDGRAAWKIVADPVSGASPKCKGVKNAKMFKLRLWIDQEDKGLAKIEADNVERVTWGGLLIRVPAGAAHVSEELTHRDDGAWLPAHMRVRLDLKLLLLKTFRIEVVTGYRDYREFQAESKIVVQ